MQAAAACEPVRVMGPGDKASFKFHSDQEDGISERMLVRFTDDAGVFWELDDYDHLEHLADRGDW